MRNLLWKEWHEQSWKLGFGCVVLGAMALIGFRSRVMADEIMMMWVNFLALTLLPVLSSTGLMPAERGEGSLESLLALPVEPKRILLAKTMMGVALCAAPMILAAAISVCVTQGREISVMAMLLFYAGSLVTTLSLFFWMLALTIRLPSETRAALLGVGILILWMMATVGLAYPSVPRLVMVISPFALVYRVVNETDGPGSINSLPSINEVFFVVVTLAAQALIVRLLWAYASRRVAD